jgi:hypothetical protein
MFERLSHYLHAMINKGIILKNADNADEADLRG